jgi:hypothetical protein
MLSIAAFLFVTLGPTWTPGTNIQRTMRLLATSTPAHRNRIKILFYGQSITVQDWWKEVEADLRRRFPNADLLCENRAIGGFAADRLKRVVIHDVFPSYPDLIILHDYGGEPDYEELIRTIRSNVASEILVQSDHEVWTGKPDETRPRGEVWHDAHVRWLQNLAKRYNLGFVDVRTPWQEYLRTNALPASALLVDGVHLNDKGCRLMASLISPAMIFDPKLSEDKGLVTETGAMGRMEFEGNRVEVLPGKGNLRVLVDDKPPSAHPEIIAFDRPSGNYELGIPAIQRVNTRAPLLAEDWTLTFIEVAPDVSRWRYRLEGSKTGTDGEGWSDAPFVSNSGRVALDPKDWYVREAFGLTGKRPPVGFQVKWRATLGGVDEVPGGATEPVVVATGLANGHHTLELLGNLKGAKVTIRRPPLKPK